MFWVRYFSAKGGSAEEMDVIFGIPTYENLGVATITKPRYPLLLAQLDPKEPSLGGSRGGVPGGPGGKFFVWPLLALQGIFVQSLTKIGECLEKMSAQWSSLSEKRS